MGTVPRQIISSPDAPSSPFYSQGVRAGSHVYVSGTTGVDPGTGRQAGGTIQAQTRQAPRVFAGFVSRRSGRSSGVSTGGRAGAEGSGGGVSSVGGVESVTTKVRLCLVAGAFGFRTSP